MNSITFLNGGVKLIGRLPAQVSRDARFGTLPLVPSEGVDSQESGDFASRVWREDMASMRESTFSPTELAPGYFKWRYLLKSGFQERTIRRSPCNRGARHPRPLFFGLEAHEAVGD